MKNLLKRIFNKNEIEESDFCADNPNDDFESKVQVVLNILKKDNSNEHELKQIWGEQVVKTAIKRRKEL